MIEVEIADHNTVVEFPDDIPEEEIVRVIQARFGGATEPQPKHEEPGFLERLRRLRPAYGEPRKPVDLEAAKERVAGLARGVREFFDVMAPYREEEPDYLKEFPYGERFARGLISSALPGYASGYEALRGKPYLPAPESPGEEIAQALGSAAGFVVGLPGQAAKLTMGGMIRLVPWLARAAKGGAAARTVGRVLTEVPALAVGTGVAEVDHVIQQGIDKAYLESVGRGAILGASFGLAGGAFPKRRLARIVTGLVALEASRALGEGKQAVLDTPLYRRAYETALDVLFLWGQRGGREKIAQVEKAVREGHPERAKDILRSGEKAVQELREAEEVKRAASSEEIDRPLKEASKPEPPGARTQEPFLKTSKAPPPSGVGASRKTSPSKSTYPIKSSKDRLGIADFSSVKIIEPGEGIVKENRVSQPEESFEKLYEAAERERPGLEKALNEIAAELGGEGVDLRIKDPARAVEKVLQKRAEGETGFNPAHIKDYLGSRIVLPDPVLESGKVEEALQKRGYEILEKDDMITSPNPWGYRAIHLDVKTPGGHVAEVQVHFKEGLELVEKCHKLYEKWRNIIARQNGELTPQHATELAQLLIKTNKWWDNAWEKYQKRREKQGGGAPPATPESPVSARAKSEPKEARAPPKGGKQSKQASTTVTHTEGQDRATYQIVEADSILPSHDMRRGFARNEDYPEKVQERPYHRDKSHQTLVLSRATPGKFEPRYLISDNPDAINGPPIVTPEGTVLGGNSRAMLIQYVYDREPKSSQKYREYLKANAAKFGLNPKDIDKMQKPMLVRTLEKTPSKEEMARKARLYNQPLTQALEAKAEGVSRARLVSKETMDRLAGDLEDFNTLREYLGSTRSKELIQDLLKDGALEQTQLNRLTHPQTGLLTEDGKLLVERTLRGKIIDDLDLLEAISPTILNKIDRALPALARIQARGEQWDFTDKLKKALAEHAKMKAAGMKFKDFMETQELFGDEGKREAMVADLIRALEQMKPTELKKAMEEYARAAERDVAKQETFGFFKAETPKEAFERIFGDQTNVGKEIKAFDYKVQELFETRPAPPLFAGLSTKQVGRRFPMIGPQADRSAASPKTPAGVERARGIPEDHEAWIRRKARDALHWVKTGLRTYRALPRKAVKEILGEKHEISFAQAAETLRHNRADYEVAQHMAVQAVRGLTRDIPTDQLRLYYDAVVAADLAYESGRRSVNELPFDMTKQEVQAWKRSLDQAVGKAPEVAQAIETRKRLFRLVADKLIEVGILKEEQIYELDAAGNRVRVKNEDYFHHQVLQYAQAQRTFFGKKITKPKPGYARRRSLKSTLDYNTDVFQADLLHLTRAFYDIRRALRFKSLLEEYDIAEELREAAKRENVKNWEELIPKGYEKQQWDPGRTFFMAETLPERVLKEIYEEGMAEVVPEDLRKILAVGRPKKEYVIPTELADTFREMTKPYDLWPVKKIARELTTAWKKSVLLLPRRFVRYNYQNMIGDLDAVIAGNPRILKHMGSSAKDLYRFYHGEQVPQDVMDAFERGVLSSTLTFEEIPRVSDLHVFDNIPEVGKKRGILARYFRQVGRWTTYRENVLRLAAYRHYLSRFKEGKVPEVGASIREDVEALADPKDRAAKVARELLGDYGAISSIGREVRQGLLPFYSWLEVNLGRYKRLIENSFSESKLKGSKTFARLSAVLGGKVARKMMAAWAKMLFLTSAIHLYNQLTHSQYEAQLSDYDRRRLHINLTRWYHLLGGDPNKTMILRGQSALGDLFEWVGLNDVIASYDDYRRGLYSGKDLARKIVAAPVNKLVQSLNPFIKILTETISGASYFPDFTKPRYVRGTMPQRFVQSLANAFTLGDEWRLLTHLIPGLEPLPLRNYAESWQDAVVIARDVDEQAYGYILNRKYRYLETIGKGGRHFSSSPESLAFYNYKLARRLKDQEAAAYWKQKIIKLKGSRAKADKGIRRSIDYTKPLGGLKKTGTGPGTVADFRYRFLTAKERQLLRRAERFHRQVFGRSP